jgi:hypothetical protein
MRVVAITALHHSLQNFVMKWLVEVGLNLGVTANAELRFAKLKEVNS